MLHYVIPKSVGVFSMVNIAMLQYESENQNPALTVFQAGHVLSGTQL